MSSVIGCLMTMIIELKEKRMIKVGFSYYFNVPMAFIKNGLLSKNQVYTISITESKNQPEKNPKGSSNV